MKTNLNILVVDDGANHRRSAELLLKGHTLTIVGTYDDAQKALTIQMDYEKENKLKPDLLENAGLSRTFNPYREDKDASDADKKKYEDVSKAARAAATTRPNFDVVLLDLLMPASRQAQGDEGAPFVGKEMPLGTFLILLALSAGVKNIGMVTDKNHHNHPASAALDPINRKVITVGETKIFATNYPASKRFDEKTGELISYEYLRSDEGKKKYPEGGYDGDDRIYTGTWVGKGWDSILNTLLAGNVGREE
jgi:CheY-like chemotaxis protein